MVEPGAIGTSLFAQPRGAKNGRVHAVARSRIATMKNFETKAPSPDVVARAVAGIIAKAHPPLRTLVTTEAHAFTTMPGCLPGGLFESLVRFGFALDR